MGEEQINECANEEICESYARAWDLYDIVLIDGLPGAIYVYWHSGTSPIEWADKQWGFTCLNNCAWLLYRAALYNSFEKCESSYYKLARRDNTKHIRTSLVPEFDRLRAETDLE